MTLTPTRVRALLAEHGVHPSKARGQHFLVDPNTAQRIVRLAAIEPGRRVVEVGPGVGSLTVALAGAGARVVAIEIDGRLLAPLGEAVRGLDVEVVHADALTVEWTSVLHVRAADAARWSMVANLPYNVATPVVVRALETAPDIERYLVMVQREVGERLAAGPGEDAYGAVSVKVAYLASARLVGTVPATVFYPRPKVESALVELVRRTEPAVAVRDEARMFRLVRAGFATRRKTLRRALAPVLMDATVATLERARIDPSARAETLDLAQWAALADA